MSIATLLEPYFQEVKEKLDHQQATLRLLSNEVSNLKKLIELSLAKTDKDKAKVFVSPNVSFEPVRIEKSRNQLPNTLSDYLDRISQEQLDRQIALDLKETELEKSKNKE